MPIMGRQVGVAWSARCQSHVSGSLENPHFNMFTIDRPTCALTEFGDGAGPLVAVVKGCEELLCSIFCS